jgi:hypothetical protein
MDCDAKLTLIVVAGFVSGVLAGFLFRFSDAERDQAYRAGYRSGFLQRMYYTPFWRPEALLWLIPLIALLAFILWAPSALLGVLPLCGADFRTHQFALAGGTLVGWFLRWLLWKFYLQFK